MMVVSVLCIAVGCLGLVVDDSRGEAAYRFGLPPAQVLASFSDCAHYQQNHVVVYPVKASPAVGRHESSSQGFSAPVTLGFVLSRSDPGPCSCHADPDLPVCSLHISPSSPSSRLHWQSVLDHHLQIAVDLL